jgi:ribonuclease BN (tRNA processing enzyme)
LSKLTFLGTGGSVLTKDRACAGIMFEDKLVDVGFGVLANLLKSETPLSEINELYVSHTHSDHIGDFTGLVWAMAMSGRKEAFRVVSSPTVNSTLKKILKLQSTPKSGFVNFRIKFESPDGRKEVRCYEAIHDPRDIAFRFKANKTDFVYTGDTARDLGISKFARGSDILIHDASFLSGQEKLARITNHSTASQAGDVASRANVKKLVLTHITPSNQALEERYISEARTTFNGDVIVAKDWLTIEL